MEMIMRSVSMLQWNCITWMNRILSLKLLEAPMLNTTNGDAIHKFLSITKDTMTMMISIHFSKCFCIVTYGQPRTH